MASRRDKIKLFKFNLKIYQEIVVFPPQHDLNHNPNNLRKQLYLLCFAQFFISTTAYLWFQANSMTEYGLVFFTCISIALSFTYYLTELWRINKILNYIENCERFIEKSEYY